MAHFYQNMQKTAQNCTLYDPLELPDSPGRPRDATYIWTAINVKIYVYNPGILSLIALAAPDHSMIGIYSISRLFQTILLTIVTSLIKKKYQLKFQLIFITHHVLCPRDLFFAFQFYIGHLRCHLDLHLNPFSQSISIP